MAILTSELTSDQPFKVEFVSYYNTENEVKYLKQLKRFSMNKDLNFIEDLGLLEYDNLAVRFTTTSSEKDEDAKLFMDCFDYIDELGDDVELEQGKTGFICLDNEIMIHRHLNNDVGSPLIPGVYKVKVVYKGETYYSQILIKPNNIEINEHYQMVKDIESKVKGLARDWIRKNKSLGLLNETTEIDPTYLDYAYLLLKHQRLMEYSMSTILKNPYIDLDKNHLEMPLVKSKKFDSISLKLNQIKHSPTLYMRNPLSNEKVYSYTMVENYDNKVNNYLVKVLYDLIELLKKAKFDIGKVKEYFNNELADLKRYRFGKKTGIDSKILNREKQLRRIIQFEIAVDDLRVKLLNFRNTAFIKQLRPTRKVTLSQQFIKTPGYNNFYRIHLLVNGQIENKIEDLFDYNWKSTEVLYEYWCMIQIIEYLVKIGYQPIQGWIYQKENKDNKITVPAIPDGTSINFKKGDYTLKLIFNAMIGKTPEQAKADKSPYWIRVERNKPDFRLDVYKHNNFIKTIIMDSKYSPALRFWNKKLINTSKKSKVVEQLKIYANNIYKLNTRRENVVEEVLALCPTVINKNDLLDIDENHSIGVATLKPGIENNKFKERLEYLISVNSK
ncbi:nuclease domain-containing protein [Ornithinibacillus sp. JPR2-1]|uniref:nuclease domain-containing protein n=1 Tax=Ornithinibacillus sp. JPR2-1 TaxID=2094019 RepID=UPI0031D10C69